MLSTLIVEKANFTEKSVDCLYFSSFLGRSEYILIRYKDTKRLFRIKSDMSNPVYEILLFSPKIMEMDFSTSKIITKFVL